MPRPLRVEGRVLSSSIRRSREMWIHFVFTIQCSGKGCICRGVSDSVAMRGCYYWVKSGFCNWWEFLMASKHAGLEIVLWLNELVRIWDCSREEGVHMPELTFYCFHVPNLLTLCSFRLFVFCFVSCGPGETYCHAVVCLCAFILFYFGRKVATSISTRHRRCYEAAYRFRVCTFLDTMEQTFFAAP
jgi:hypothetical protein